MRVLLVASPKNVIGFDRSVRLPNLGLTSIAANLDKGLCEVKIVDLVVAPGNVHAYYQKLLQQYQPDVVGLSCMTFQFAEALNLAGITKRTDPKIKVVLGGYHPTVDYDSIYTEEDNRQLVDFIVRSEGEHVFNELIKALQNGHNYEDIANLSYFSDGQIIHNPANKVLNVNDIKLPDRDARILKKGFHLFGYPADVIETSRGCSFDCDFCSITTMYGRSFRRYDIERVIKDIRDTRKRGTKALMLADDNATLDGKRYKDVCQAIIDEKYNDMNYYVQASIKGLKNTPGLIETMVRSGGRWVFLGIENVADDTMTFLDKRDQFSNSEAARVIAELKEYGAIIFGGFIIGNPDDTEESVRANYEYAKELGVDVPIFGILTPLLRTPIREKLIQENLVTNIGDYSRYNGFDANVRTRHLSSEKLYELREELGHRYPFESGSIWRILKEFPLFLPKMALNELKKHPRDVVNYLKGFVR